MSIGQNIKLRRRELDMTLEDVAKEIGLSRQTLSRYETGVIGNIPSDKIEALACVLRTTPAYLMGWDTNSNDCTLSKNLSPLPNFIKKPRLGAIACGKPILAIEDASEFDDVPDCIECDFTLLCKGDSMINARIFDGDIVYIRAQPQVENGEIAAVRIGDEATLKRVYYSQNSNRITLRAANPLYPDMDFEGQALEDIEILGKAVAFTSMIVV